MTASPADLTRIRVEVGSALDDFIGRRRGDLARISPELISCADAITDLLAGGKRLRAAFCYWGWRAGGGVDCKPIFAAAGALELLHASALVHDDVMDGSDTRRGQPAMHRRFAARHVAAGWRGSAEDFGTGAAILAGDLLLAWTDEMLRGSGLPPDSVRRGAAVLDLMRTEVLAGQCLDLLAQASGGSAVASALRVITYKSAKYTVERPLQLGAAMATTAAADAAVQVAAADVAAAVHPAAVHPAGVHAAAVHAALSDYGIPLGVAFQLRDDVLGVFGDPLTTGKPVNDDLREGKRTVLLAVTSERASPAQARVLDTAVGDPHLSATAADDIRAVITSTGALAECELMIDSNVREALSALDAAPITADSRAALAELAVTATARMT